MLRVNHTESSRRAKMLLDCDCELTVNAGHTGNFLSAGGFNAAHRAKGLDESLAPGRSDAGYGVDLGDGCAFAADISVISDGEAVRLVADSLNQIERLRGSR